MVEEGQNNTLEGFVTALDASTDVAECFAALTGLVESLGYLGIVYTLIPIGVAASNQQQPIFLSSDGFDRAFLKHYAEADFASRDYTIKRILDGNVTPTNWWLEADKGLLDSDQIEVIQVARSSYGLVSGISIPTSASDECIAGASVVSDADDDHFLTLNRENLFSLQMAIRLFHSRVEADPRIRRHFYLPVIESLTAKEIKVLKYLEMGLPLKAIGDEFSISPSAAGNVRSRLFKKLGVSNSTQLAYVLGMHRILSML